MANETKHTPGPWQLVTIKTSVGECHRIGEFHACVYDDHTSLNKFAHAELLANARLIAAAPELLEALGEMVAEARERNRAAGETVFNPAALQVALAAIAKATGASRD